MISTYGNRVLSDFHRNEYIYFLHPSIVHQFYEKSILSMIQLHQGVSSWLMVDVPVLFLQCCKNGAWLIARCLDSKDLWLSSSDIFSEEVDYIQNAVLCCLAGGEKSGYLTLMQATKMPFSALKFIRWEFQKLSYWNLNSDSRWPDPKNWW